MSRALNGGGLVLGGLVSFGGRADLNKVAWPDLSTGDTFDLQSLRKAHPPRAVDPVIHLALADRWAQTAPESGLGEAVSLKVVAELH